METTEHTFDEIRETVSCLKWFLVSLRISGVEVLPRGFHPSLTPAETGDEALDDQIYDATALNGIRQELGDCRRCRLHEGRNHIVFGEGAPGARLVFVGEGPGFEEDQQGRPFVGKAGKLLDRMIRAIGFQREEVYICNVVKCRPPSNRTPQPDEIDVCSPFLLQQLHAINPTVICALGSCAVQTLLATTSSVSRLRARVHHWRGIPVICTFHPAYLLRNPSQKEATWRDLLEVHRIVHEGRGG
ncbi:MAG: uracil-DNA glycosylase [Syntrophobacteraceae bacterium]|nr:uracil-DNA glycosylase [Syntrophobacteraceae bacterium]